jgi:predicted RNase H-like HicB family nuclease
MKYNNFILTNYIESALDVAVYDKLEDNSYAGKIPECKGVLSFANNLKECQEELRSVFEEWVLLGLKLNHSLPIINGIDLNQDFSYEPANVNQAS